MLQMKIVITFHFYFVLRQVIQNLFIALTVFFENKLKKLLFELTLKLNF